MPSAQEIHLLLDLAKYSSTVDTLRQNLEAIATRETTSVADLLLRVRNDENETVLHAAAEAGAKETILFLFRVVDGQGIFANRSGARALLVQAKTKNGETALMRAARADHAEIVMELYLLGASLADTNVLGMSPSMIATTANSLGALSGIIDLLDNDPALGQAAVLHHIHRAKGNGEQPIHVAVRNGNLEIATLLVQRGANVNSASISSMTPLHLAADMRNAEMTGFLLANGSSLNLRNAGGQTAMHLTTPKIYTPGGTGGVLEHLWKAMLAQRANRQHGHVKDVGQGGGAGQDGNGSG